MSKIILTDVKDLHIDIVQELIEQRDPGYSWIKQNKGYFEVGGSYMFEFPMYRQYSFAEIQKLYNKDT